MRNHGEFHATVEIADNEVKGGSSALDAMLAVNGWCGGPDRATICFDRVWPDVLCMWDGVS